MASIYSDEMKEKILADFSSKNPKVSASIIERFGENPRSKGIGSLTVEQYRDTVDAPLYANQGTTGGIGSKFMNWFKGSTSGQGEPPSLTDVMGLLKALSGLFGGSVETPVKAPRYRAPKTTELEGMGTIGMAYGGRPRRYEKGSEGGIQDPILEHGDPGLIETLRFLGLSDEAIVNFVNTVGDIPEGVVDTAISLGQKARDAGLLEDPRDPDNGMNDGGTVLNRKLFLGGGEVDGIGGERDDLVPIWASDREYVVSANGVRRMGGGNHARGIAALDEINNDGRLV
jgi:hypothetical protein